MDFSRIKTLLGAKGKAEAVPDAQGQWTCDHCGKKGPRIGVPDYTVIFFKPRKEDLPGLMMGTVRQCQSCHHMTCTQCVANTRNLTCPECGVPCEIIPSDINEWCVEILNENQMADLTMRASAFDKLGADEAGLLADVREFLTSAHFPACEDFYAQMYTLRFHHGVAQKMWTKEDLMLAGIQMKMKAIGATDPMAAILQVGNSKVQPTK